MVATQKEFLPKKAQKADEPNFLWIVPPLHDRIRSKENELRTLFGRALCNLVSLHEDTYALELKKGWDPKDKSLYNRDLRQFTAEGMITYWEAGDKTVKYFDTLVLKKKKAKRAALAAKEDRDKGSTSQRKDYFDRYHWSTKYPSKR